MADIFAQPLLVFMFLLGSAGQTDVFAIDQFAQLRSHVLFIFLPVGTVKDIVCVGGVGGVALKTFELVKGEEIVVASTVAVVLDVENHHILALLLQSFL